MSQALLLLHSCFRLPEDISLHSQQGYGQQGISAGAAADSQRWCMTFPSKAAAHSWKAGSVARSSSDTAQLLLHQPVPSFCKLITGEGQKCSDIKTEGSELEVAARHALSLSPCPCPVGFGWKGGSMLWWCVVISWAAKSPDNSCVSHPEHCSSAWLCSIKSHHVPHHCRLPCPGSMLWPRDEDMEWRQCLGLWRSCRNPMFVSQSSCLLGLYPADVAA